MTLGNSKLSAAVLVSSLCLLGLIPPTASGGNELGKLCTQFSGFDQNRDRQVEIASLRPIIQTEGSGARVMMLVEARLLESVQSAKDLRPYLERWAADLKSEGCRAEVVAITLAKSPKHQDGRYVLAIRDFLRAAHAQSPLAGVVLVGHFPDATLIRSANWRKKDDITLRKKTDQAKTYESVRFLQRKPGVVAAKADIVLADLKGNWDKVYIQQETAIPSVSAIFKDGEIPPDGGRSIDFEEGTHKFEDVFHIADGAIKVRKQLATRDGCVPAIVTIDDSTCNLECSAADSQLPNGLAVPDILVSRIDARGVALNPRMDVVGLGSARLLDQSGKPQEVKFPPKQRVPNWDGGIWQADPALERRLLAEYFDRNHAYRTGTAKIAWRPSSIAYELGSGYRVMLAASKKWDASDPKLRDIRGEATLVDFINWLEYPAILRTVRAHSFSNGSQFHKTDYKKIEERVGGPIWSWTKRGNSLVPSLQAASGGGMLNWHLLRTLYENGKVAHEPCFYHHIGCNGISPPGVDEYAYDHPRYGQGQGAEALLFYGNGLALVGRAKVYNDEPRGFTQELGKGRTFGQAWAKYFEVESQDTGIHNISRKRAYFWSLLGDWTLKLSMPNQSRDSSTVGL